MAILKKVVKYLSNPDYRFIVNAVRGAYDAMPDEEYLKKMFKAKLGYELNLDNPRTFNEKLQWLKLHDRKPIYVTMVDKYEAKQFIADRVGEEYVIPTLGVWDRAEDIDFDQLPDRFVMKTTHDSGGVVVCKDKTKLDIGAVKRKLETSLRRNYFYFGREWPYKDVKPRIIAEELLESAAGAEIKDYKLHCINGNVRFLYITSDRFNGKGLKADYFDEQFNRLNIQWELPNSDYSLEKPVSFELMKSLACRLAEGITVLRVDFYEVDGRVYVGELTFFDGSGFAEISGKWDETLGGYIELPVQ